MYELHHLISEYRLTLEKKKMSKMYAVLLFVYLLGLMAVGQSRMLLVFICVYNGSFFNKRCFHMSSRTAQRTTAICKRPAGHMLRRPAVEVVKYFSFCYGLPNLTTRSLQTVKYVPVFSDSCTCLKSLYCSGE